jgi:hypothetical protein
MFGCPRNRVNSILLHLQPVTQRHQLIHLRYDPLLLSERWDRDWKPLQLGRLNSGARYACAVVFEDLLKSLIQNLQHQKF